MAFANETSFDSYTFSYQWTINHLGARLSHPDELKSPEFCCPGGARPATKWRIVLFIEQDAQSSTVADTEDSAEEYVSLRLNRVIQLQPNDGLMTLGQSRGSRRHSAYMTAQVQAPEEPEIWVEAQLKTPKIVNRKKRETGDYQSKGPVRVSNSTTPNATPSGRNNVKVNNEVHAVTFNHCLATSKLRDSLCVTFDCEIQVWLLDKPVHVYREHDMIKVPKFNLGKLMEENRRKNLFTDVTLVAADKKEFRAHKAILAAQSDFFKTRFSSRWQDQRKGDKVELTDVPGNVMEVMLSYMYTGEVAAIEEVAISVLPFAEEYGLEGLRKMCEQSLAESLTSDNAVDFLINASTHNALYLKKVCANYISSNPISLRKNEGLQKPNRKYTSLDVQEELYHLL